jgi:hypothetical protein
MVELIIEENKTMMMDPTTWTPTQESGGNWQGWTSCNQEGKRLVLVVLRLVVVAVELVEVVEEVVVIWWVAVKVAMSWRACSWLRTLLVNLGF